MEKIKNIVTDIYNELKSNNNGKVADYIPELSKVNPLKNDVDIKYIEP